MSTAGAESNTINRSCSMGKPRAAPSQRQLRVGELIRHELAEIFTRGDVLDPVVEKAGVTVTQVEMSPDLRVASSYVRPFGVAATARRWSRRLSATGGSSAVVCRLGWV
jgi:ribosome-binding factor A